MSDHIDARAQPLPDSAALTSAPGKQTHTAEIGLAALVLVLLGVRYVFSRGATSGLVAEVVLAPLWLSTLKRFAWARVWVGIGFTTIIWGLLLTVIASADHRISEHNLYGTTFLFAEIVFGVGIVLWARTLMPTYKVGAWYGAGLLIHAKLYPGVLGATNPLKFNWLVPLAVVVLSLAYVASRGVQLAAVTALAALAGLADSRAVFGTALITMVLLVWQLRPRILGQRARWTWTAVMSGALVAASYNLASTLLIDGYLGSAAQQRSAAQVQRSGSLLLGGRPELSATWALIKRVPGGFGPGTIANAHEINIAKAGMVSINYDPNNDYVNRFMFGSSVELHSVFGDFWAWYGYLGIAIALLITAIVVVSLSRAIALRSGGALVLFFGVWVLWNVAFSPVLSAGPTLLLAIGLLLAERPPIVIAHKQSRRRPAPQPRSGM